MRDLNVTKSSVLRYVLAGCVGIAMSACEATPTCQKAEPTETAHDPYESTQRRIKRFRESFDGWNPIGSTAAQVRARLGEDGLQESSSNLVWYVFDLGKVIYSVVFRISEGVVVDFEEGLIG